MQVVGDQLWSGAQTGADARLRNQRDATSLAGLKRLCSRNKPAGAPEARLFPEFDSTRIGKPPSGKRRLAVIRRRGSRSLSQFLELPSEHVVHSQGAGNFLGDVQ